MINYTPLDLKAILADHNVSQKEAAALMDCSLSTITRAVKKPSKYNEFITELSKKLSQRVEDVIPSTDGAFNLKNGGKVIEATRVINTNPATMTESELRKTLDIPEEFELQDLRVKVFNMSSKDNDGNVQTIKNYSTQAKFTRTKGFKPTLEELVGLYQEVVNSPLQRLVEDDYTFKTTEDMVLVLPMFDVHYGKMAWGQETGSDYDHKIATKYYLYTVMDLFNRAVKHENITRVIFPFGSDFFQYDSLDYTTVKGTRQDSDLRWKKLFRDGTAMAIEAISMMAEVCKVDLLYTPGNHDESISFYAYDVIGAYFTNHKNVEWDTKVTTRNYRKVGTNLLGFTHGDQETKRIYGLMQQEAREYWGTTTYAEWIVGHHHKEMVNTDSGVVKRTVTSISGTDSWHYTKGFVGSLKAAQGFIYNPKVSGPYVILYSAIDAIIEEDNNNVKKDKKR